MNNRAAGLLPWRWSVSLTSGIRIILYLAWERIRGAGGSLHETARLNASSVNLVFFWQSYITNLTFCVILCAYIAVDTCDTDNICMSIRVSAVSCVGRFISLCSSALYAQRCMFFRSFIRIIVWWLFIPRANALVGSPSPSRCRLLTLSYSPFIRLKFGG